MSNRLVSLFLTFSLIFSVFTLSSCEREPQKFTEYYFDYFDTVTTIAGYEKSQEDFDRRLEGIKALLEEYHNLYTIYGNGTKQENLYSLNNHKGNRVNIKLDPKIIDLLVFSKEMYTLTNGNTNIALGSVLSIWHDYRNEGIRNPENAELPDMNELIKASKHTDIAMLKIDKENNLVSILDNELLLDVGAVAKGYAVEQIAKKLKSEGVSGYIINVGGNVKALGKRPDGTKWTVGVENPNSKDDNAYLKYLKITDEAVVTSGSYQRFYTVDGKEYHHIIDHNTLMPSENFRLVSVVAKDSGIADALSTALFTMNFDKGLALVESIKNVEALWLFNDDTIKTSKNFNKYAK